MGISFNNIRTNKKYTLINYGEKFEFTVIEIRSDKEFLLKDVNTLELYKMSDLVAQGQGNDFAIWEI